jgi:hypothetical protein
MVGAENCEERSHLIHRCIVEEHCTHIRQNIPGCQRSKFIFMPESNLALTSSYFHENIKNTFHPSEYEVIMEDRDRPGWRTDKELKVLGTKLLKPLIIMNCLRFHYHFFTCPSGENMKKYANKLVKTGTIRRRYYQASIDNPDSEASHAIRDVAKYDVMHEIVRQLSDWKEEVIISPITGEAKTTYSGKHGGKTDDLAMCLIGGVVMIRKIQNTYNTIHKMELKVREQLMSTVGSGMGGNNIQSEGDMY